MRQVSLNHTKCGKTKANLEKDLLYETKKLQDQIKKLTKHNYDLNYILSCTGIGTIILNKQLQITHFTPPIECFLKLTKNDIGKPLNYFINPLEFDAISKEITKVLTTDKLAEKEITLGTIKSYWMKVFPYSDGETLKSSGVVLTFTDTTERKEIEAELIKAKNKAEESDRLKSTFLSNISHEIRTPMNAILGFSNLLCKNNIHDERKGKYAEIIKRNGQQLINVIDDILDISQIELNQITLEKRIFLISTLLREFEIRYNQEKIIKNKPDISIKAIFPASSLHDEMYSDPLRMHQVFNSLLGNALKFTYDGKIEFGYEYHDGEYLFFVKDTGIGISKDKQEVVFELFRQEDEAINKEFGGTGLGLTIAKALVKVLGGDIWVSSMKGKGSSFFFTIPNDTGREITEVKPIIEKSYKEYDFSGKTVLLAEDDITTYEYFSEIFEETKVTLLYAANGKEAFEIYKERPGKIDMILLDIQMPVLNGFELAKQIRAIDKTIPILAQTAYAMKEEEEKCYRYGCSDYITKPIKAEHLLMKMEKLLKN